MYPNLYIVLHSGLNNNSSPNQNVTSSFKSSLGDFPASEKTVFERNDVITHWKPVLFVSKKLLNLWCHMIIQRNCEGLWKLMIYSMLPKECTDQIRVKITVGDCDMARCFSFSGKVNSYQTSNNQVFREGHFLCLHDDQVKPFKHSGQCKGNILFNYSVDVDVDEKLISGLDLRSQRIYMDNPMATIVNKII